MRSEKLLSRLSKVSGKGGNKWIACCPAHDDKTPSLAITELQDGRVLVKCFAGCSAVSVVQSVGLTLSDLYPEGHLGEFDGWFRLQRKILKKNLEKEDEAISYEKTILELARQARARGERLSQKDLEREREAYLKVRGGSCK